MSPALVKWLLDQFYGLHFYFKVFVPLTHDGVKSWIFSLVCSGNAMSVYHEGLLLLKSSTAKRNLGFDEVCGEKHVYIAYNNEPPDIFEAVLEQIIWLY